MIGLAKTESAGGYSYEHHLASESGTFGSSWVNYADVICYAILNEIKCGNYNNASTYYNFSLTPLYTAYHGFRAPDGWYDAYKLGLLRYVHKVMAKRNIPYSTSIDSDANSLLTTLQAKTTSYSTQDGTAQSVPSRYDYNLNPSSMDTVGGNCETNAFVVLGTIGYDW